MGRPESGAGRPEVAALVTRLAEGSQTLNRENPFRDAILGIGTQFTMYHTLIEDRMTYLHKWLLILLTLISGACQPTLNAGLVRQF